MRIFISACLCCSAAFLSKASPFPCSLLAVFIELGVKTQHFFISLHIEKNKHNPSIIDQNHSAITILFLGHRIQPVTASLCAAELLPHLVEHSISFHPHQSLCALFATEPPNPAPNMKSTPLCGIPLCSGSSPQSSSNDRSVWGASSGAVGRALVLWHKKTRGKLPSVD